MKFFFVENRDHAYKQYISENLNRSMVDAIEQHFFKKSGLAIYKIETTLQITLHIKELESDSFKVEGPFYSKNKYRWAITLNTYNIKQSENIQIKYIELFFEAFANIANYYKVGNTLLEASKHNFLKKIQTESSKYKITEQEQKTINWVNDVQEKYRLDK